MAEKATAPEKKGGSKKATAKKRVSKGEAMVCEVCGLSVVVEEVGGVAISEESVLLCCGHPMKEKAKGARAAKK